MIRCRLLLQRDLVNDDPDRRMGRLYKANGDWIAEVMEPGDADRDFPRLHAGFYVLEPHGWDHEGVRFQKTYAFVGANASHYTEPGVLRSTILFHHGVRDEHTKGCPLLGSRRGTSNGEPAVLDDMIGGEWAALERLRDWVGPNYAVVTVIGD